MATEDRTRPRTPPTTRRQREEAEEQQESGGTDAIREAVEDARNALDRVEDELDALDQG